MEGRGNPVGGWANAVGQSTSSQRATEQNPPCCEFDKTIRDRFIQRNPNTHFRVIRRNADTGVEVGGIFDDVIVRRAMIPIEPSTRRRPVNITTIRSGIEEPRIVPKGLGCASSIGEGAVLCTANVQVHGSRTVVDHGILPLGTCSNCQHEKSRESTKEWGGNKRV